MTKAPKESVCTLLEEGLQELGFPGEVQVAARLAALSELVCDWGRQINLSGHRTPEAVATHLVLDAVALSAALPSFDSLADLGSGAGFPGLPIAILYPQVEVCLVEARMKRHHFQRAAVRALSVTNASPIHGRVEAVAPRPSQVAIAQAMGPAASVLDAIRPWARHDGWLAVPASSESTPPPLETNEKDPAQPAMTSRAPALREVSYNVPGGRQRKLWLVPAPPGIGA